MDEPTAGGVSAGTPSEPVNGSAPPITPPGGSPPPTISRGTYLSLRADIASIVSAFAVSIIVSRALGPADRGVYFLAVLVSTLIALFGDLGMSTVGIVFGANRRVPLAHVHGVAITLSLAAGAVGAALLVPLEPVLTSSVLRGLDRPILLLASLGIAPLLYARILGATLTGLGRIRAVALIRTAVALLLLTITAPVVLITHSPFGGVAAWVGVNASFAAMLGVYMLSRGESPARPSRRALREMLAFGLRGHLGTLAHHGFLRVDVLFVSAQLGPRSVGLYSLASVTAERISILGQAVYSASARRMGTDTPGEAAQLTAQVVRLLLLFLAPAAVLLAVLAEPLMTLVYGSPFRPAAVPFELLLPGTVCLTLWAVLSLYVVSALGRPGTTTLIQATALLVAVPFYFLAVRWHGMVGAAVVSSVVYMGVCAMGAATLIRTSSVRPRDLLPGPSDLRAIAVLARRAVPVGARARA